MKLIKWKKLGLTSLVCLLPILLGIALWEQLPDTMAIHFDIYNQPDNFASKGFVVFGLPCLMVLFQGVCCVANDINAYKRGENKKLERATTWIIPVMTTVLQVVTLGYGLGWQVDIRRVAMLIAGGVLVVIGNYLPKLDYIKNYEIDAEKARKINRFLGYETVIMGFLYLGSIFFSPVASVVCLLLLIPYMLLGIAYGIKIRRS